MYEMDYIDKLVLDARKKALRDARHVVLIHMSKVEQDSDIHSILQTVFTDIDQLIRNTYVIEEKFKNGEVNVPKSYFEKGYIDIPD